MDDKEYERALATRRAADMRQLVLDGKARRWDVSYDDGSTDLTSVDIGYFGTISVIQIGGMQTVVRCEMCDGILHPMLDRWYDGVRFTGRPWDADTRFTNEPNADPIVARAGSEWTLIPYRGRMDAHGRLLPTSYYEAISLRPSIIRFGWFGNVEVFDAVNDGRGFCLSKCGTPIEQPDEVEPTDKGQILERWIWRGRPCYHVHGFRWKGARPVEVDADKAVELLKKSSFDKSCDAMEWDVVDGRPALLFSTYSEGDML